MKCERCGASNHIVSDIRNRSLNVEMAGRNVMLAQFTLCRECYTYGGVIEPIGRVHAFLNPEYEIVTDIQGQHYYITEAKTGEYIRGADGRVWETELMDAAQDKLADLDGEVIIG